MEHFLIHGHCEERFHRRLDKVNVKVNQRNCEKPQKSCEFSEGRSGA
jgi:hypothetical protein